MLVEQFGGQKFDKTKLPLFKDYNESQETGREGLALESCLVCGGRCSMILLRELPWYHDSSVNDDDDDAEKKV